MQHTEIRKAVQLSSVITYLDLTVHVNVLIDSLTCKMYLVEQLAKYKNGTSYGCLIKKSISYIWNIICSVFIFILETVFFWALKNNNEQ